MQGRTSTAVAAQGQEKFNDVAMDDTGLLKPRSLSELYQTVDVYMQAGCLPAQYKNPHQVIVAMQYAAELGLPPLSSLSVIANVKGSLCLYADGPMSLVQRSGKLEWVDEFLVDKNGERISMANKNVTAEPFGAFCIAKRVGDEKIIDRHFTMRDAARASLTNSPCWKAYPQRMLIYRARSAALKDKFSDCLRGISIAEYDHNIAPEYTFDEQKQEKPQEIAEKPTQLHEYKQPEKDASVKGRGADIIEAISAEVS